MARSDCGRPHLDRAVVGCVMILAISMAAAGCGSSPASGAISGRLGTTQGGIPRFMPVEGTVRVLTTGGVVVETIRTGQSGSFHVDVKPGHYIVAVKVSHLPDCLFPSGVGVNTSLGAQVEVVVHAGLDSSLKRITCQLITG